MSAPLRVIVFGSRTWTDYMAVFRRLAGLPPGSIVVHGGCQDGADAMADTAAKALALYTEPHPADWLPHGPHGAKDFAAGPKRNSKMARLGADLAIGFRSRGKSRGTDDMRRKAERAGIPVELHGEGWAQ